MPRDGFIANLSYIFLQVSGLDFGIRASGLDTGYGIQANTGYGIRGLIGL